MFVRVRTNTWNAGVTTDAVEYYTPLSIPVVLTFMAYFDTPIEDFSKTAYTFRKRTLNSYNAITFDAWKFIMHLYEDNPLVYSCGREGEGQPTGCKYCGNCLREYYNTIERMKL